ncbi:MAG: amino acid ABC transporter substrate-binding protein [Bacteroidia bacterium]|nr:amino acid ABC transporter substrate-binding protein [Bacteroidia bacterium]
MISAPNHRQLLNGNRLLAVLLIPFLLISCGAFKKTTVATELPENEEVVVVNPEKKEEPIVEKPVPKVKEKKVVYSTVVFKGESYKVPVHKRDFHIAVLLPFHLKGQESIPDKRRASYMLEYYQGMKLAISEIEKLGSKFNIHYFDTDNDTSVLKQLLRKSEMEKMDLLIGPTDDNQLRIASYYARKHEIPLFSPITTAGKMWSKNPYVFNLNPSEKMQAMAFIEYFKKHHKDEQLVILRDDQRFDRSFGEALIAQLEKEKINYSAQTFNRYMKWGDILGGEKTVVLSMVQDKTNMLYTVNSLLSKEKTVTLMGSDKWLEYSSVDFEYWERLNMCFLSTNLAQVRNEMATEMTRRYRYQYKDDPSWYTYMGFDQLLFSCEVLDAFGQYFPMFLENKVITYGNSSFNMTMTDNCFHNKYLQIFQYKDKEIITIPQD